MCRSSANTENSRRAREQPLVPGVQQLCILLTSARILGGSCNNEWILEEANDDNDDIASCMETDEDENGEQISYIEKLKQCAACRLACAPSVNHRLCCMWLLGRTFSFLGGLACVR